MTDESFIEAVFDVVLSDVRPPHPNQGCHLYRTTMGRCRRCKTAAAVVLGLAERGYFLPERYFEGVSDGKPWTIVSRWGGKASQPAIAGGDA